MKNIESFSQNPRFYSLNKYNLLIKALYNQTKRFFFLLNFHFFYFALAQSHVALYIIIFEIIIYVYVLRDTCCATRNDSHSLLTKKKFTKKIILGLRNYLVNVFVGLD
jgi:hypothetical protein